jgi:hypothetical protein
LLLGKETARQRRTTRAMYYRWQERDLLFTRDLYQAIINRYDGGWADVNGMGRAYYVTRTRMINNELRLRKEGP